MDELNRIRDIIAEHEAGVVSVPGQGAWYENDLVCVSIIRLARKRGHFYKGEVVEMVNIRCRALGLPGRFTSKSNPVSMATWRGMIKERVAEWHSVHELDIPSALAYLRGYKPRQRKERS